MHPNPAFNWTDRAAMLRFVAERGFAHIFAASASGLFLVHAPLLVTDDGKIWFHVARRNRIANHVDGNRLLISITGRDAYQSANWYESANQVPTWHYEAVEIEGEARMLADHQLVALLDRLSDRFERKHSPERPWTRAKMGPGKFEAMVRAIVGIEVDPVEVRGTSKFNQHKSADDLKATIRGQQGAGRDDIVAAIEEGEQAVTDDELWKKRFQLFMAIRLVGLATFLLGIAIAFSDLIRPGGWKLVGGLLAFIGVIDAVIAPRILKRGWGAARQVKRFWQAAEVVVEAGGYLVVLDGRRLKTPARADLLVPSMALADAIAAEWNDCDETFNPGAMPLTGLANAAIDRVAPNKEVFASGLARYAETDLICYRAEGPDALVRRQAESWDTLLAWARRRYDVDFACVVGVMHVPQPTETLRKLGHVVATLTCYQLAGLSPLVTIGGSLIAGLAVLEEMLPAEDAWEAVSLDDRWQLEQWGDDAEARSALDVRRRDYFAAVRFLELLS